MKQAVRTPKITATNLDNDFEQTTNSNQINNGKKPLSNGHINGDLTNITRSHNSTKQKTIKFVEDEQPIDDYWKKRNFVLMMKVWLLLK